MKRLLAFLLLCGLFMLTTPALLVGRGAPVSTFAACFAVGAIPVVLSYIFARTRWERRAGLHGVKAQDAETFRSQPNQRIIGLASAVGAVFGVPAFALLAKQIGVSMDIFMAHGAAVLAGLILSVVMIWILLLVRVRLRFGSSEPWSNQ